MIKQIASFACGMLAIVLLMITGIFTRQWVENNRDNGTVQYKPGMTLKPGHTTIIYPPSQMEPEAEGFTYYLHTDWQDASTAARPRPYGRWVPMPEIPDERGFQDWIWMRDAP